jgi:predicted O-linked N-acetylglucosamine transferase (SPINDLY family)
VFDDAARQYKKAISLKPDSVETYVRLADLFRLTGNIPAAEKAYRMALHLDKKNFAALTNLGNICRLDGRYAEALHCYRQSLEVMPGVAKTLNNLALCLMEQGDLEEAQRVFRQAVDAEPRNAEIRSNFLFCLCYSPAIDYDALWEEHRRFGSVAGTPADVHFNFLSRDRSPDRKLRIGFVSADFRDHSVRHFIRPVLAHIDPRAYETVCYSLVEYEDILTGQFKELGGAWRNCVGMPDRELAEKIYSDSVDVLFDLSGHTAGNRLPVFALRPAPVQVTYCGYPNTTGMKSIDYRITDPVADPPGEDRYHTERLVRLDGCFLCYAPPDDSPACERRQEDAGSEIVFGSFNTLSKINSRVIALWSRILGDVPGARLVLKRRALDDTDTRLRVMSVFARNGVNRSRVECRGHSDSTRSHLEHYGDIDICLDTFPYNGTTTTCESLWMGVPVVALAGRHHASRVSASILHACGNEGLVAQSEDEYVSLALRQASDGGMRDGFRRTNRERMRGSVLCDARGFVVKFERALRAMWQERCTGSGP